MSKILDPAPVLAAAMAIASKSSTFAPTTPRDKLKLAAEAASIAHLAIAAFEAAESARRPWAVVVAHDGRLGVRTTSQKTDSDPWAFPFFYAAVSGGDALAREAVRLMSKPNYERASARLREEEAQIRRAKAGAAAELLAGAGLIRQDLPGHEFDDGDAQPFGWAKNPYGGWYRKLP